MKGLTSHQSAELLKQYGLNTIAGSKKKNILVKFFEQFNNFLTILLMVAAFLSFLIGEPVDGALIIAIVILNGLFGIYQEAKAEESLEAISKMTVTKVRVFRDGREQEIDSRYLVPGDIVFIEEGVKVPADGKIIEARSLEINEAALTGESMPVVKNLDEEIFMGTIVARGRGYIEITKTGMKTKFGSIATELSLIQDTKTPLQKKLEKLTRLIGIVGIVAAVAVFFLSLIDGSTYFPAFLLAISLAVAVVPEGLPAVMTITLAIGVKEMAKKKSIIRKLSAIEALGSVTLIATDKTGTLTTNKMKVKEVYVNNKSVEVGQSQLNQSFTDLTDLTDSTTLLLLNGILCSTASLVYIHDHGAWDVLGDPTEGALLCLGQKVGLNVETVRKEWELIEEFPFDSVTKRMSVIVKNQSESVKSVKSGNNILFSKGAPESILTLCNKQLILGEEKPFDIKEKEKVQKQVEEWGRKGLRVLAFSYKKLNQSESVKSVKSADSTLRLRSGQADSTFLGLVAIHDAPRPETVEAVKKALAAGIKVVMITGDNEKTAEAIAVHTGIMKIGDEILTGAQIDKYTDKELLKVLPRVKVFARTTPFHKHKIVKLLQEIGEVVVVTGDGVNDAIALKQADVGVAMGLVGTDVARETADMVITDDNFASIVTAVEEGRNIIKNLKNAITYLLSCNVTEAVSLTLALILGFPHIFYPLQFLYINLVTDGLPALSLAFSPRNTKTMSQPPEKELSLINSFGKKYIFFISLIASILVLSGFYFYSIMMGEQVGKTAAFSILVLIQSFIFMDLWLSHQSFHLNYRKLLSPLFFASFAFPFVAQLVIISWPVASKVFNIVTVSPQVYLQFILIAGAVTVGIKGVKMMINK